jgi:hypothetical protein
VRNHDLLSLLPVRFWLTITLRELQLLSQLPTHLLTKSMKMRLTTSTEVMTTKACQLRRRPLSIAKTRWLAYATASAATTVATSNELKAAIHYSGRVEAKFPPHQDTGMVFQLDQPGDYLYFRHIGSFASFTAHGLHGYAFRATASGFGDQLYVSKLSFGQDISTGQFQSVSVRGILAGGDSYGQWRDRGVGFIGFRFNNGAGNQYGWARVKMTGSNGDNGFKVLDYAYADPGESIKAGQRSDNEMVTNGGSLGALALGAAGLVAWRNRRSLVRA